VPRSRLAVAALAGTGARAEDAAKTGFVTKTYKNADGTASPYVVFVPHDYDGKKAYPVVVFLHGSGETKGGTKQPVEVGIGSAIKKQEKTFPFITLIPQAETKGWGAEGPNAKRALGMLDEVTKQYKTDPNRVYLTGLSMGGYGTWSIAAAHPEKWAAIVPVCGGGESEGRREDQGHSDLGVSTGTRTRPCRWRSRGTWSRRSRRPAAARSTPSTRASGTIAGTRPTARRSCGALAAGTEEEVTLA